MSRNQIFAYITTEANNYKSQRIPIVDGYEWNMYQHIRRSVLYKNSKFESGENDGTRPFKNIVRPVLSVAYRTEGFDVKDIEPYVDDSEKYYLSFLYQKFHPRWALRNKMDMVIDTFVESYADFGLGILRNIGRSKVPVNIPLTRIAFCDQANIAAGAIGLLHNMSVAELYSMKGVWYEDAINQVVEQSKNERATFTQGDQTARTPSKNAQVYDVEGMFPETWLNKDSYKDENGELVVDNTYKDETKYVRQVHIVSFVKCKDEKGKETEKGVTLFCGRLKETTYKFKVREGVDGRACGIGGIEELFDSQVWANYSEIRIKEMLDAAALNIYKTTDMELENNNKVDQMEQNQIIKLQDGKDFAKVDNSNINIERFTANTTRWENQARVMGFANESLLGISPSSGTPFKLQEYVTEEGKGTHDYRRGQVAVFFEEVYREWVLPALVEEMSNGQKFMDRLSLGEMQKIADNVAIQYANDKIKKSMLKEGFDAKLPTSQTIAADMEKGRKDFMRAGETRFFDILEGELKELPTDVMINVAGKQKDLNKISDKLTNIFRQIIANPAVLQAPGMGKLFNEIIQSAGLSPIDFTAFTTQTQNAAPDAASIPGAEDMATKEPVLA